MASLKELLSLLLVNKDRQLETLRMIRAYVAIRDPQSSTDFEHPYDHRDELFSVLRELVVNDHQGNDELTRRLAWQIVHNCCVGNAPFTHYVIATLKNVILSQLPKEVVKTQNVLCAIILVHFQLAQEPEPEFLSLVFTEQILGIIIDVECCDFSRILLHEMLKKDQVVSLIDQISTEDKRMVILDVFEDDDDDGFELRIYSPCILKVAEMFKKRATHLLTNLFEQESSISAGETSKLLLILGKASSTEMLRPTLQQDMSLLIDTMYLLRLMHDATKEARASGRNAVVTDTEDTENSPYYGFKCGLIRLIGNLCFRHQNNQNQVLLLQ